MTFLDLCVEFRDEHGDAAGVGVRVRAEELSGSLFCLAFLGDVTGKFVVEPLARVPHPHDANTPRTLSRSGRRDGVMGSPRGSAD